MNQAEESAKILGKKSANKPSNTTRAKRRAKLAELAEKDKHSTYSSSASSGSQVGVGGPTILAQDSVVVISPEKEKQDRANTTSVAPTQGRVADNLPNKENGDYVTEQGVFNNIIDWAYRGDHSGLTWNTRALFADNKDMCHRRQRKVVQWVDKHDYLILEETHVTANRASRLQNYLKKRAKVFYSQDPDNPKARGGIIVIVKTTFLEKFSAWKF